VKPAMLTVVFYAMV